MDHSSPIRSTGRVVGGLGRLGGWRSVRPSWFLHLSALLPTRQAFCRSSVICVFFGCNSFSGRWAEGRSVPRDEREGLGHYGHWAHRRRQFNHAAAAASVYTEASVWFGAEAILSHHTARGGRRSPTGLPADAGSRYCISDPVSPATAASCVVFC